MSRSAKYAREWRVSFTLATLARWLLAAGLAGLALVLLA